MSHIFKVNPYANEKCTCGCNEIVPANPFIGRIDAEFDPEIPHPEFRRTELYEIREASGGVIFTIQSY